jgi:hypothetical protein
MLEKTKFLTGLQDTMTLIRKISNTVSMRATPGGALTG